MVSFKVKFRSSIIEDKDGSLYYQVIYKRTICQIATSYLIKPSEWNASTGDLVISPKSERTLYLESIKLVIQRDIRCLRNIVHNFTISKVFFSVDMIVAEFNRTHSNITLFNYMEQMIARYCRLGQHLTSETYSTILNSFKRFRADIDVYLEDIDSELMEAYENHLKQNDLSPNTISFYMKHLRAVYKRAVDDELQRDKNPFKRVSTSIEKTAKRAISFKALKLLKAMDLSDNSSKRFARDMFLFSFYTRGMSFIDIAYLQKKNLKGDVLSYRRRKTNQPLKIGWEPDMQEILKLYGADTSSPYLFSIIKDAESNPRKQYQNMQFLINRHLKEIGKGLGLHQPLTMYCARHSWASIAHEEGISLSIISEGMGHDSEKTAQIYLASLKTEVIDKLAVKL